MNYPCFKGLIVYKYEIVGMKQSVLSLLFDYGLVWCDSVCVYRLVWCVYVCIWFGLVGVCVYGLVWCMCVFMYLEDLSK